MALSGVEIFKLLPKTNCKKCRHPTCLAFAMKLAQRQASLEACPDVSEEAKKILGEASAPPVRPITLGSGDKAVKMGEETVLFRHDKRFVNPCVFALEIKDTLADDEPIIYGVNSGNAEAMANIAKTYKAILGITASSAFGGSGGGLDEIST